MSEQEKNFLEIIDLTKSFKIDAMMYGMCESYVNDAIRRAFSVKKVTTSHTKGKAVMLTEADISGSKLRAALEPTGYRVLGVSTEEYEKNGAFEIRKRGKR